MTSSTTVIPTASSAAWTIAPSDCENRSPIALTSPVTRVTQVALLAPLVEAERQPLEVVVDAHAQVVA